MFQPKETAKTIGLHFLFILIYCYLYEGPFLMLYPPSLMAWVCISFLLGVGQQLVHRQYARAYTGDWLYVQLWLNPLLYMGSLLSVIVVALIWSESLDRPGFLRQALQLPYGAYSTFVYVLFLMIFTSGTLLFLEGYFRWFPRLKSRHLGRGARAVARVTLVGLVGLAGFGSWFILAHRANNLTYLKAIMLQRFGEYEKALNAFDSIPPTSLRQYLGAHYRMGRIELRRQRRFLKAFDHFMTLGEQRGAPMRDEALYQALLCLYSLEALPKRMQPLVLRLKEMRSHLWDESLFLLVQRHKQRGELRTALGHLNRLKEAPSFAFSVRTFLNLHAFEYELTQKRAEREARQIELKLLPEV